MATVHVVMAETQYATAFNVPYPVAVFVRKQTADDYAEAKNKRATRLHYYVRPAKQEPRHD